MINSSLLRLKVCRERSCIRFYLLMSMLWTDPCAHSARLRLFCEALAERCDPRDKNTCTCYRHLDAMTTSRNGDPSLPTCADHVRLYKAKFLRDKEYIRSRRSRSRFLFPLPHTHGLLQLPFAHHRLSSQSVCNRNSTLKTNSAAPHTFISHALVSLDDELYASLQHPRCTHCAGSSSCL